jgi:hypothetical protein
MLLLACARREATHDLVFRERYLKTRTYLHERRCPRRVVLLTSSAYPMNDETARGWRHEHVTAPRASRECWLEGDQDCYPSRPEPWVSGISLAANLKEEALLEMIRFLTGWKRHRMALRLQQRGERLARSVLTVHKEDARG